MAKRLTGVASWALSEYENAAKMYEQKKSRKIRKKETHIKIKWKILKQGIFS